MEIVLTDHARNDLEYWRKSGSKAIQLKITRLLEAVIESPFTGIGKPEPLKFELTGTWSRRITSEHRMVYEVEEKRITILSFRGHY